MQYPAPGSPRLAQRIAERVQAVSLNQTWGLDHGAWCPLSVMYPQAAIPVVQLSLDAQLTPAEHYALGKQLAFLRTEGVLVLCSGNIVHNLRRMALPEEHGFEWAQRFDAAVCDCIASGAHERLLDYAAFGEDAMLSIPTDEHYVPLLYALALQTPEDTVSYPVEGFAYGSLSMRSVLIS